jgi:hypothetical protein
MFTNVIARRGARLKRVYMKGEKTMVAASEEGSMPNKATRPYEE